MSLRIKDEDVTKIVDEFEERTSELKIPLLAFYELLPEKLAVFKHLVGVTAFNANILCSYSVTDCETRLSKWQIWRPSSVDRASS